MLKKTIVAGTALALLSSVAVGVPIWSYARCGVNYLQDSASESVPLEWELKRARQMISDLKPEIRKNATLIAREKIEVVNLKKQVTETSDRLAKSESDIERLSDDLARDSTYYTYAGRTYTSIQVKDDLKSRFKRHKTRQQTSEKLHQMLSAREQSLNAAHERMDAMLSARRQLEVEVENLQARVGALRVAQTSSQLSLDDSQLSQTRQLLNQIATRIDVEEETMIVDDAYYGGGINLEEPSEEDLLDDIASYFSEQENAPESGSLVAIQID